MPTASNFEVLSRTHHPTLHLQKLTYICESCLLGPGPLVHEMACFGVWIVWREMNSPSPPGKSSFIPRKFGNTPMGKIYSSLHCQKCLFFGLMPVIFLFVIITLITKFPIKSGSNKTHKKTRKSVFQNQHGKVT